MAQPKHRPTEEAYAELQQALDFYNAELFGGELPPCLLTFQRQKKTMGYFHKGRFVRTDGVQTDEIALNPGFFAVVPMVEVLQTLVHEQVHQWQDHKGKPSRACYHNREWAEKMESIGLMPSDTGLPGGKKTGQCVMDYVIEGGPFDLATRKLLASGFAITWLDRFPEQPPAKYQVHAPHMPEVSDLGSGGQSAYVAPNISNPGMVELSSSDDRSNRHKYQCPNCRMNLWGKGNCRILCIDCKEELVDLTAAKIAESKAERDAA